MHLQPSITLQQRFVLDKPIRDDATFVHTYRATDQATNQRVLVREYFPSGLAERSDGGREVWAADGQEELFAFGKTQFLKEARALGKVDHDVVAPLVDAFEAHGTAYQVLRLPKALPLARVLQKRGKPLPLKAAVQVIDTLLAALSAVHSKGLIHGALYPRQVYVTKKGAPRLVGFQTAQILTVRKAGQENLMPAHATAPEQRHVQGKQGPWTDVYAAAALFYTLVTGDTPAVPTDATPVDVHHEAIPPALIPVLTQALAPNPRQRTRSPQKLRTALQEAVARAQEQLADSTPDAQETPVPAGEEPSTPSADATPVTEDEAAETASVTSPASAPVPQERTQADGVADGDAAADTAPSTTDVPPPDVPSPAAASTPAGNPVANTHPAAKPAADDTDAEDTGADNVDTEGAMADGTAADGTTADDTTADRDLVEATARPVEASSTLEPDTPAPSAEEGEVSPTPEAAASASERPISELPDMIVVDDPPPASAESDADDTRMESTAEPAEAEVEAATPASENVEEASDTEEDATEAPSAAADRAPEAPARDRASKKRWVATVLGLLLIVALAGGAYFFTLNGTGGEGGLQYASLTAEADSLFEAEDYALAGTFYQQARVVRPEDAHVAERLAEAEARQAQRQAEAVAVHQTRGDALLAQADSLLDANATQEALAAYSQANEAYLEALRHRPDDATLPVLINRTMEGINQTFAEREQLLEEERPDPAAVRQQLFAQYWQEGNALIEEGNFEAAERRLSQAQEFRPNDPTVEERLSAVRDSIAATAAEETFRGHMQRARSLENQQRWSEASVVYQRALNSRPGNPEALAGLTRVEDALEEERRVEQQYQYLRGQGDVLSNQGRYQEALQSYRQAQEHRPQSSYLQDQIAAMEEEIAQIEAEERRRNRTREDGVYVNTDTPVQLIGGLSNLYEDIRYPSAAARAGVSGRVFVQFVVTAEGTVRDAEVIRGLGAGTEEEALRVIRQASFEPATVNGQPVDAQHTLFIDFSLEDAPSE
ncbi:MAG: TonB family protein [Bacteroidetes bacterium]|jgi:TonB family protein|nr:TonB family protein [Bacteroidota bacterium]